MVEQELTDMQGTLMNAGGLGTSKAENVNDGNKMVLIFLTTAPINNLLS